MHIRDQQGGTVKRFVIIGGGPAGTNCATHAARLGADVTLIEKDIVGGAAHLLDCIPSKAMIATGGAMSAMKRAAEMGLATVDVQLDFEALRVRIGDIEGRLESTLTNLLESQGVRLIEGTGRLISPHEVEVVTSTVVRPRSTMPTWLCSPLDPVPAFPTGRRSTAYGFSPPVTPIHLRSCLNIWWWSDPA